MESAESHPALKACRQKFTDAQFDVALEEHYFWQMIRLASTNLVSESDKEFMAEVLVLLPKASPESQLAKLDYSAEIEVLKNLYQNGSRADVSLSKVLLDLGDTKLRP